MDGARNTQICTTMWMKWCGVVIMSSIVIASEKVATRAIVLWSLQKHRQSGQMALDCLVSHPSLAVQCTLSFERQRACFYRRNRIAPSDHGSCVGVVEQVMCNIT